MSANEGIPELSARTPPVDSAMKTNYLPAVSHHGEHNMTESNLCQVFRSLKIIDPPVKNRIARCDR